MEVRLLPRYRLAPTRVPLRHRDASPSGDERAPRRPWYAGACSSGGRGEVNEAKLREGGNHVLLAR